MKDDFYNLLAATYNKAPRGDILVIMGDLNTNEKGRWNISWAIKALAYATTMERDL